MNRPVFTRFDGSPLPPGHHLAFNPRGKYVLRATVDRGEKYSGRRITVQLGTHDPFEAQRIRDAALEALHKAGCLTRDIMLSAETDIPEM